MTRHLIAEVHYQANADRGLPSSEAPLRCTCGVWVTSGTWLEHRGQTETQKRVARNHESWQDRQKEAA